MELNDSQNMFISMSEQPHLGTQRPSSALRQSELSLSHSNASLASATTSTTGGANHSSKRQGPRQKKKQIRPKSSQATVQTSPPRGVVAILSSTQTQRARLVMAPDLMRIKHGGDLATATLRQQRKQNHCSDTKPGRGSQRSGNRLLPHDTTENLTGTHPWTQDVMQVFEEATKALRQKAASNQMSMTSNVGGVELRHHHGGLAQEARMLVRRCNDAATQSMRVGEVDDARGLLRYAQGLLQLCGPGRGGDEAAAVTHHSLGCLMRRIGRNPEALFHLQEAKNSRWAHSNVVNMAEVNLTLSSVYSSMRSHDEALALASDAGGALRDLIARRQGEAKGSEIFDDIIDSDDNDDLNYRGNSAESQIGTACRRSRSAMNNRRHAHGRTGGRAYSEEDLTQHTRQLCVALHNMAVEQEAMGAVHGALLSYDSSIDIATQRLGPADQMTRRLRDARAQFFEDCRSKLGDFDQSNLNASVLPTLRVQQSMARQHQHAARAEQEQAQNNVQKNGIVGRAARDNDRPSSAIASNTHLETRSTGDSTQPRVVLPVPSTGDTPGKRHFNNTPTSGESGEAGSARMDGQGSRYSTGDLLEGNVQCATAPVRDGGHSDPDDDRIWGNSSRQFVSTKALVATNDDLGSQHSSIGNEDAETMPKPPLSPRSAMLYAGLCASPASTSIANSIAAADAEKKKAHSMAAKQTHGARDGDRDHGGHGWGVHQKSVLMPGTPIKDPSDAYKVVYSPTLRKASQRRVRADEDTIVHDVGCGLNTENAARRWSTIDTMALDVDSLQPTRPMRMRVLDMSHLSITPRLTGLEVMNVCREAVHSIDVEAAIDHYRDTGALPRRIEPANDEDGSDDDDNVDEPDIDTRASSGRLRPRVKRQASKVYLGHTRGVWPGLNLYRQVDELSTTSSRREKPIH